MTAPKPLTFMPPATTESSVAASTAAPTASSRTSLPFVIPGVPGVGGGDQRPTTSAPPVTPSDALSCTFGPPPTVKRLSSEEAEALLANYDVGPADGNGRLVVVAMSGGVDSAVTALVLRERGYRVVGMNMRLYNPPDGTGHVNPCCSLAAMEDARSTCAVIDVPFYPLAMQEEFETHVIGHFVDAYAEGRTPNPCLECNRTIKFRHLIAHAKKLGATALATGHYSRIERSEAGTYHLYSAIDERKDQSYALHTLTQEQLAYIQFPLGRLRKPQVRDLARAFGLPVAEKPESQDICFVGKGSYAAFVAARRPELTAPGTIELRDGTTIGEHHGLLNFTIGQRRGIRVAQPEPLFVQRLDTKRNVLVVGPRSELAVQTLRATAVSLTQADWPSEAFECEAMVRYRGSRHAARIEPLEAGSVRVTFIDEDSMPSAAAPGQAVVFYRGDEVLGGGTIAGPEAPAEAQTPQPVRVPLTLLAREA